MFAVSPLPQWPSGQDVCLKSGRPGFNSCLHRGSFFVSSHTSYKKIDTPAATLLGAWRYRVSTGTGYPCVSIVWLGEIESLVCNFYLSVADVYLSDP